MLISGVDVIVPEAKLEGGDGAAQSVRDQVFEIIEADPNFEQTDTEELQTRRDLILIYRNIDISTETQCDRPKQPNQRVETVVHDDPEDSDVSEGYSNEELDTVFKANEERLDLLDKSSHKFLCHKLRGINPTNDLAVEYQRFFKDPYLKTQLNKITSWPSGFEFSTVFPTSLFDYICANGFDDNYSLYMDNVITYVKLTIEQLKRISNGEFLTERAKETWQKIEGRKHIPENNRKVLATCSSIPKIKTELSKWEDIIHSEVDIRSLCRMLDKKIVIKVPKMISGSCNMFKQDMTISCKVEKPKQIKVAPPRLDVVVKIDNLNDPNDVNSIMLHVNDEPVMPDEKVESVSVESNADLNNIITSISVTEPICIEALIYKDAQDTYGPIKSNISIVELDENDMPLNKGNAFDVVKEEQSTSDEYLEFEEKSTTESSNEAEGTYSDLFRPQENLKGNAVMITPYELSLSMQKLNIQNPLPEEVEETTSRKKSPTRIRIKSPYENKSYILEEKKRKKLLEIRQRREKRKQAVIEKSQTKNQRNKALVTPHASNSVTRLSITNKAFYNSIYGHNVNSNKLQVKTKRELHLQIPNNSDEEGDIDKVPLSSPEHDKIKYVNRSYYLDDAVTEVEMNDNDMKEVLSASSTMSTCYSDGIKELLDRLPTTPTGDNSFTLPVNAIRIKDKTETKPDQVDAYDEKPPQNVVNVKIEAQQKCQKAKDKKKILPLECRKSIDKIYDLLRKISESDSSVKPNQKEEDNAVDLESSIVIATDSGTSMKHQLTSNPSSFSFGNNARKKWEIPTAVVPKVIINAKTATDAKSKDSRKKFVPADKIPSIKDNPLKAISQLLHNIDTVQKSRQKSAQESRLKPIRKIEAGDNKGVQRQVSFRKTDIREPKLSPERRVPTPKKQKPPTVLEHKTEKKKLIDLVDEAREARGEAVKGPKSFARLNALAQPRKSYIQAHNEEIKSRFGKSIVTERLQRLVDSPAPVVDKQMVAGIRRPRRAFETVPATKAASASPLGSPGRRPGGSPERRAKAADDGGDATKKPVAKKPRSRKSSPEAARPARVSRAPLVPDYEIASNRSPSPEFDSARLGDKLHQILSKPLMINRNSRPSDVDVKKSISKDLFIIRESISTTQDFPVDIFADKTVLTAVEAIADVNDTEDVKYTNKLKTKSILDLQMLENALYTQMYTGSFHKRLRIKNFTLTPKHSMQQIMFLQSGDQGSELFKPVKLSASKSDTVANLKSVLTKPCPDAISHIPMQVATVGFAFPRFEQDVKKIIEISDAEDVKVKEMTTQSSQANCDSISDLSVTANVHSSPSDPKSNFTFIKNVDDDIRKDLEEVIKGDELAKEEEKKEAVIVPEKVEASKNNEVDCTSSLDILVKLLSEIQNITTNQTDITKIASCKDLTATEENGKPIENNAREIVSLTSLEQMRQLESSPSLYSFYLSSDDEREIRRVKMLVPYYKDKGVTVDVRGELVNNFTDVPSSLFPAVCRSTNISDVFGVIGKSSSHSTFAISEYGNRCLNTRKSVIEIKDDFESDFSESANADCENKAEIKSAKDEVEKRVVEIEIVETGAVTSRVPRVVEKTVKDGNKVVRVGHDFTPDIKMKRDILVTVYSFLVLTIFAALSFPGVVYQSEGYLGK